jgi:hypothetical protein
VHAARVIIALLTLAAALPGFDLATHEKPRLVRNADAALRVEVRTIVAARNPRSAGGLHDFSSEGDYWWPDPKNPDGPYIQRDGLTNPDNFVAHRQYLLGFVRSFGSLAAAYRVTHDERYAARAVAHLAAWFVTPETRMNPSLEYSQAIKGRFTGRGIGVIDTVHLAEVALGVEALRGSRALTPAIAAGVVGWFRAYHTWIREHKYGSDESKAENNHGTCWALQAACFAHLIGDESSLADCRRRFREILLPNQLAADGSFPREMVRTKPYGYAIFNTDVMTALAVVLSTDRENFITWALPDGRSLAQGIGFLAPYIADKQAWLRQVKKPARPTAPQAESTAPIQPDVMYWDDWPVRQPCLIFGALTLGRADWLETWKRLNPDPSVEEIVRNFPIREPVLWVR